MKYVLRAETSGRVVYYRGNGQEKPNENGELIADTTPNVEEAKRYSRRQNAILANHRLWACERYDFEVMCIVEPKPVKPKTPLGGKSIHEVNRAAQAVGMSYGKYVAKYGQGF